MNVSRSHVPVLLAMQWSVAWRFAFYRGREHLWIVFSFKALFFNNLLWPRLIADQHVWYFTTDLGEALTNIWRTIPQAFLNTVTNNKCLSIVLKLTLFGINISGLWSVVTNTLLWKLVFSPKRIVLINAQFLFFPLEYRDHTRTANLSSEPKVFGCNFREQHIWAANVTRIKSNSPTNVWPSHRYYRPNVDYLWV